MRRLILLALAVVFGMSQLSAQKIKGSETVLPITQKAAELYLKVNPKAQVSVTGGGSGVGIAALIDGTTDLAQASRKIKFDERQKIQQSGNTVKEVAIAYDALAIIINPGNKVTNLTREQVEGMFTGKIKNWKEVGGEDMKVVPYSRETSSGTYEFFKESVLKNKNHMSGIMSMPANGAIIQSVKQTKGAIAYVGLAYVNKDVKAVHISYDKGKTYVEPSVKNAVNKTYPIVRPLYFYYLRKNESKVKAFVDYILSPAGQEIVKEVGYVNVK
ncbi:MAG TPA: PstS family phosphate ABC transporter substrate-binding protein [Bacteroidales bacterium]|nr:PstS family phosphate ABC transporter substrate-binding protein [Bacteroidales bacterium]HOH22558.1 PstS family phosphate ABC transporter substrate-binding protein [Bacteroidales bacterium]HPZ02815.1 PstS family phosphate ABC transporter substrate-binding protein [Bacteroidales bacterium]HQB74302.1 PstS family phosphate ABC transporter substrate-binding protein [Bacteroidales bacterium]